MADEYQPGNLPPADPQDIRTLIEVRNALSHIPRQDVDAILTYLREWNKKRPAGDC